MTRARPRAPGIVLMHEPPGLVDGALDLARDLGSDLQVFSPGYFGEGLFARLERRLGSGSTGGWLNFHRLADPLGDAVFTGPDERARPGRRERRTTGGVLLHDPATQWRFVLDPCPKVAGRSGSLDDERAVEMLDTVAGAPPAAPGQDPSASR